MRKTILITGASSGLGAGMARVWAAKGHDLALTARRLDRLEALKAELEAAHPTIRVVVHALDVTDHEQVFAVVKRAADDLGGLDRVVVNAGLGKGARIGTGKFEANRETAETNFVAALAQCEAAMEHFYERRSGHLVVVSSVSAMRGMPSSMTTYAATKAGIALLAEGIRSDLVNRKGHDIAVTTVFPGYIASEMNDKVEQKPKGMVDTETGSRALVAAIDSEKPERIVPAWPWRPVAFLIRHLPLGIVRRMV
ncbi:SDR family oxidoreductase [Mumia sp. ZJ1417]|uniref:SDR family oxidoreductase n=1 Tax=Mumia sp. ZJ1417 TaxID=2708082 RepID=UPI00141EDB66|nr:SDR family oxidoreductase [Mumia sp. ZJ1417]QMW66193.1 SDR family oxidoreductase [Mumia sp. ZJ1417]